MRIDVESTPVPTVYQMVVGLVTPRPIAWVTTCNERGEVNLAPFSFFNVFGANPPIVVISPTLTRDGKKKDTLVNIESTRAFVINAATEAHAEQVNQSSAPMEYGVSEADALGLRTVPSRHVLPPRLEETPWAMECKVLEVRSYGNGPIAPNLVIGQVVAIEVDDRILGANGLPDPRRLKSIARLGGEYWCRTQDLFELTRPQ